MLIYCLDNFVAVFIVGQTLTNLRKYAQISYNLVIDLVGIPKNNSKDIEATLVIVFRIEINTKSFTPRLLNDKLEKAVKAISKVLAK